MTLRSTTLCNIRVHVSATIVRSHTVKLVTFFTSRYNITKHLANGKFYILYKDQFAFGRNRVCFHYKRQRKNRLMLFRVTTYFYCQMHTKNCVVKIHSFLMLQQVMLLRKPAVSNITSLRRKISARLMKYLYILDTS
jgi:hypothetical protein